MPNSSERSYCEHVIIVACPHPLSCCIYTALIPCLAAYILPSSPVLLHIYCPHPLSCCIYTALIPCLAAYKLPSSPVLLHIYCLHPLSCCIYTALVSLYLALSSLHPSTFFYSLYQRVNRLSMLGWRRHAH